MNQLRAENMLPRLRALHQMMRDTLRAHVASTRIDEMCAPDRFEGGDTIYALDVKSEEILIPFCESWSREQPFLLVCEGLPGGRQLFGCNDLSQAQFVLICDPIDGTRPLMYDKRSAWMLTGIAPNLGDDTNLSHIEIAVQTELTTSRALLADTLWAVRGQGAFAETFNLSTGESCTFVPQPSRATTVEGGFASFAKFFPGSKGWLANLEEELLVRVLGKPGDAQPQTFDDQYISTGGQLYEMISGRDRFNADLRPLAHRALHGGHSLRLCCHPYDVCTELIARELGVIITDGRGAPLQLPLDVTSPVTWIGYANEHIRRQIEPVLLALLSQQTSRSNLIEYSL
jgi:hypothetical protein